MAMTELFNMLAGTSTGAILVSTLSVPNENGTNKFWA